MLIRIINPTITEKWESEKQKNYQLAANPGVKISVVSLENGTVSIESYRDLALTIPGICDKVLEAKLEGVDGVIIDNMLDVGVPVARELMHIPVIGPGEASMRLAATLGHRFSILTTIESLIPMVEKQVDKCALSSKLASVRALGIPVLALRDDPQVTLKTIIDVSEKAVERDGAHVIIPGCTSLGGMAPKIQAGLKERGYQIIVIDPLSAVMQIMDILAHFPVKGCLQRIFHSQGTTAHQKQVGH